jgi:hypothetical protein
VRGCRSHGAGQGFMGAALRHHAPHFQMGGSMMRRLALGVLGAFVLMFALAAVSLAGSSQANAPPTVAPTPATSMTMPGVTVNKPGITYGTPARATQVVTPAPVAPPMRATDIVPLAKAPIAKPRTRSKTKTQSQLRLPRTSLAYRPAAGGWGFL